MYNPEKEMEEIKKGICGVKLPYICFIYSGECYKRRMRPVLVTSPNHSKGVHSIQLIEIPPTPEGHRSLRYSLEGRNQQLSPQVKGSLCSSPHLRISE